jgi:hypothetical protein
LAKALSLETPMDTYAMRSPFPTLGGVNA